MIRLLDISDYDAIYSLWNNTEEMGLRTLDDSKEGIEKFIKRNPKTNFIAIEGDEVVGVIMSGHDGRRAYIYHAVVKPTHRKKNIGKALVKCVVESMEKEGINKICLVVYEDNKDGNIFWETIGFSKREDLVYRNMSINEYNV